MADDVQAFGIFAGDDGQIGIGIQHIGSVHQFAVYLACQCGFGQARADRSRHVVYAEGGFKGTDGAVGQGDV